MRQSKAVGRTVASARRAALTTLGAGLVVGAAAPIASAATVTDTLPPASPATTAGMAPLGSSATAADTAPLGSTSATSGLADSALSASTAALTGATTADWSRLGRFKLYPLAGTGIDPLSNVVSTSLGGIPVSTAPVSQMVADGLPVNDLPVIGPLFSTPKSQ